MAKVFCQHDLAHGAFAADPENNTFGFFNREVRGTYTVKKWEFTANQFHEHMVAAREAIISALEIMNVTEDQITEYGREAGIAE